MFLLDDYDYDLPEAYIAQKPLACRDSSKLLYLQKSSGRFSHHEFFQLPQLLLPSDLLVINNTSVIPARLKGIKDTGGKAEVLILDYNGLFENQPGSSGRQCSCLVRSSKPPRPGSFIIFNEKLKAEVLNGDNGQFDLRFVCTQDLEKTLEEVGQTPLPPYIKRPGMPAEDRTWYQTVYARHKGAVAAPTAGLHFSEKLLHQIKAGGIQVAEITLHVGYGTFSPVRVTDIRQHKMHAEKYEISEKAAHRINTAKAEGRRVVAVGTTCVRTLEYAWAHGRGLLPESGNCDLYIYPGYGFKVVDAMVTNFHLPKSTLLMLVSAFAGREKILKAYAEAKDHGYRFYSYGDAMLIA